MASISQNQYDYLTNLSKGDDGNAAWAKSQLQGATVEAPKAAPVTVQSAPTNTVSSTSSRSSSSSNPTSTLSNPGYGNGGGNYNDMDYAGKKAMEAGLAKVKNDPAYVQDEITRSLAVIQNRQGAGMDISAQEDYLYNTLGYKKPVDPVTQPVITGNGGGGVSPRQETAYDPGTFKQDMTDLVKQQAEAAYAAQLAKLQALRDQQLLGLKGQENLADQHANSQANKASAANAIAAQRLKERLANMGLLDSGYSLDNVSDLNAQRQSELGSIEQQRNNNKQAIEEQRSQINNAVAKGDLALLQEIQAKQAQQLLDLGYAVDSREFQNNQFEWSKIMDEAGVTGNYGGQRTLQGQAFDWNKEMDKANLTGIFGGQSTLQGKQANWNAMKDVWEASGEMVQPKGDWSGLLRQVGNGKNPLTQASQQTKLNNLWQSANQTGFISNELADAVGLPRGTTTLEAQRLLLQQDQNAQGWAGLDIRQADAANNGSAKTLFTAGQIMNNIQDGLVKKETVWDATQGQYVTKATPISDSTTRYNVFKQAIMGAQGFTDSQVDGILAASGFSPSEINEYKAKLAKEYGLSGK